MPDIKNPCGRHYALFKKLKLTPPAVVFCLVLKKSLDNLYLKTLDFSQLFVADAPMREKIKQLVFPPLRTLFLNGLVKSPMH